MTQEEEHTSASAAVDTRAVVAIQDLETHIRNRVHETDLAGCRYLLARKVLHRIPSLMPNEVAMLFYLHYPFRFQ